jgi:hypothetical protein
MVNGYYPVVEALAQGLDIRLNQRFVFSHILYCWIWIFTVAKHGTHGSREILVGEQSTSKYKHLNLHSVLKGITTVLFFTLSSDK